MDVLFNELSLTGQFLDQNDFVKNGLRPLIGVLKEMEGFSTLLLKKSDVWERMVTPTGTLHSLLVDRTFDGGRLLKSKIEKLTKEPFWDSDSKQRPDSTYFLNGSDIRGSSPAEACERDKVIVSFLSSPTSSDPLPIAWNGVDVPLLNLIRPGRLTEFLWDKKKISFEAYLKARFSGGRLDFSKLDGKMGLSEIEPMEHARFIDAFGKFQELSWKQIHTNTGLDYKEYHGNIDQRYRRIHKFRVSRKFRCHGYREKDSFVVISLETDHKSSDRG